METEHDTQCLKRVLMHDTTALSLRDKQNLYCIDQFWQGGLRARRRFFECVPHYLSFLGKSLEDVRREMEDFDWEEYKKQHETHHAESPSLLHLSEKERKIMQLGSFATEAELRTHLAAVNALGDPNDFYHGRLYDMEGFELRHLAAEDGEDEEDEAHPRFRSLRFVSENFVAVYGAMSLNWLPDSKWAKAGQEEARLRPSFGGPDSGDNLSTISEGGESRIISPINIQDHMIEGPGSRLAQNLIDYLLETDPSLVTGVDTSTGLASPTTKGKEKAIPNPYAKRDSDREIRYTRHEKSDMVYWQAEALFMSHLVQEKIERGLRQAHWIAESLGWEKDITEAEHCF